MMNLAPQTSPSGLSVISPICSTEMFITPKVSNLLPHLLHDNQSNFCVEGFLREGIRCGLDDMDTNFTGYRANIRHDGKTQGFVLIALGALRNILSPG